MEGDTGEGENAPAGADNPEAAEGQPTGAAAPPAASDDSEEQLELYPDWESLREGDEPLKKIEIAGRDSWSSKLEFLLAAVSTAVGLGNVWRFAFTALENGGGAFLLPYLIVVVLLGTPLYYFEISMGQFASGNVVVVWDAVPLFKGLGYSTLLICICSMLYYVAILAVAFRYLFASFATILPWSVCDDDDPLFTKESSFIFDKEKYKFMCSESNSTGAGGQYNWTEKGYSGTHTIAAPELYYRVHVLRQADDLSQGLGDLDWKLSACLFLIWSLVFLNLMFGTKSSGKFAYFTALFPYFVLIVLFVTALAQEGAVNGIIYLFTPNWSKLYAADLWFNAVVQVFFSLGVGYGSSITYGSFNPFRQPGLFAVCVICAADTLTSIFAAVTVFASLGSLANNLGYTKPEDVGKVVQSGSGLAFQAYPQVVSYLPFGVAQFISFCFFLMLISLGLGSGSSYVHAVTSFIFDRFERLNATKVSRIATTGAVTLFCFLVGLMFCSRGGKYMSDFFDTYSSGYVVFVTVTISLSGMAYVYGFKSFVMDLQFMYGYQPEKDRKIRWFLNFYRVWGYIAPLILTAIIVYAFATYKTPKIVTYHKKPYDDYDLSIDFPVWYQAAGWTLFMVVIGCVPVYGIIHVYTRKSSTLKKKFLAAIKPNRRWGPKDPKERTAWAKFKGPLIGLKPFVKGKENPAPGSGDQATSEQPPAQEPTSNDAPPPAEEAAPAEA